MTQATSRIRSASVSMSRRQVMIGAAGLSFAVALGGQRLGCRGGARHRARRQGAEPVGVDRARRHHHHHVGGDRDGAGVDDLAAADHRRGARRRLVEGADRAGAADRGDLRQSGLPGHDVHRRLQRGDELLHAVAHVRRAGAPGAARQCRQEARRAGRGTDHRAERGGARQVRPQARAMATSPRLPRSRPRRRRSSRSS